MQTISLQPIGRVHSTRKSPADDTWDKEQAHIELDPRRFTGEALQGLDAFSHAEIIFHMDQVEANTIEFGSRHPRNNKAWPKVGIFSQRGKNRPNQLGLSVCRIVKIEGNCLFLAGLDAVDGTPVLDIKPWVQEFAPRGKVFQPKWISELMERYWC